MASFAIDGHRVRATCPVCQHVMTAAAGVGAGDGRTDDAGAPGEPIARSEAAAPADACPKCGAARSTDATACATCGLAVDRMAAYTDAHDAAVPEPVREAWARALAAWSDDARHHELMRLVATHNTYAWAAGRYRTRGDDPIAQRQLDRMRRAAEATLLASATVRPGSDTRPYRGTAGVLAVLIVVIVVGLLYAVVIRDHPTPRGATRADPAGAPGARPLIPGHPVSPSTIK